MTTIPGKRRLFAFSSPYDRVPARDVSRVGGDCLRLRGQRGFVLGARFFIVFFVVTFLRPFFLIVDFFTVVLEAAVTLECLVARALVAFLGAASADDVSANAASNATSRQVIVFRIIKRSPPEKCREYDNSSVTRPRRFLFVGRTYNRYASAKPICATNIMRYMWAHDTWFSSTARSSGRRSMRYSTYSP